jgi:hypothetical protein
MFSIANIVCIIPNEGISDQRIEKDAEGSGWLLCKDT